MKNRTKDKIAILGVLAFMFLVAVALSALFIFFVENIAKAETKVTDLTEKEQINKFYTEETIKNEMYYLSAWETVENMSQEEFENTFYKGA